MLQQLFNIKPNEISIVIPVKDNQRGIDNYLQRFFAVTPKQSYPCEINIVDNNSSEITTVQDQYPIPVRVLTCTKRGPGAARNVGVEHSSGSWILFHDSDVVVDEMTVEAYCRMNYTYDWVGMQGRYIAMSEGHYTHFYSRYMSANPLPALNPNTIGLSPGRWEPYIFVTANCMANKDVFQRIGGFDEQIVAVASEDLELGIRLKQEGHIGIVERSIITHHLTESLGDFCDRWTRYARGDSYVSGKHPDIWVEPFQFPPELPEEQGVQLPLCTLMYMMKNMGRLLGPPE